MPITAPFLAQLSAQSEWPSPTFSAFFIWHCTSMTSPVTVFDSARSDAARPATMARAARDARALRIMNPPVWGRAGADYTRSTDETKYLVRRTLGADCRLLTGGARGQYGSRRRHHGHRAGRTPGRHRRSRRP